MWRRHRFWQTAGSFACLLIMAACGDEPGAPSGRVDVWLRVSLPPVTPRIERVTVDVTAPDLSTPLTTALPIRGDTASGSILVPPGAERRIIARGFTADDLEGYRRDTVVVISADAPPALLVTLSPLIDDPPAGFDFDTAAIVLTPASPGLLLGDSMALRAELVTRSGARLGVPIAWSTGDVRVAGIDSTGLLRSVGAGATVVRAAFGGTADSVTVHVFDASAAVTAGTQPLVRHATVNVTPAGAVRVRYVADGEPALEITSAEQSRHEMLLTRLLAATAYTYTVTIEGVATPVVTDTFTTGPLPPDLAAVGLAATGSSTAPLVMLELRVPTFQGFAAVDDRGRVVWYHRTAGSSWGWTRRANGNFVFLDTQDGLTEVTPADEVVATLPRAGGEVIHHDVIATPQNTLYFMTRHPQQASDGQVWTGEQIWEWNPDTGDLLSRWNAFDMLSPTTDAGPLSRTGDWLHTNALRLGPAGHLIVSSPFLNQIIAIAPDFSEISWRLGGPNATVMPDSTFVFQHTATQLPSGNVLLFDNRGGMDGGVPYSRALELQFGRDSARTVWSFRAPNGNYAAIISSAWRMENGNTMVAFGPSNGWRGSIGPIEVYEVEPDGTVRWNLVVTGPNHMYRATPFEAIASERINLLP